MLSLSECTSISEKIFSDPDTLDASRFRPEYFTRTRNFPFKSVLKYLISLRKGSINHNLRKNHRFDFLLWWNFAVLILPLRTLDLSRSIGTTARFIFWIISWIILFLSSSVAKNTALANLLLSVPIKLFTLVWYWYLLLLCKRSSLINRINASIFQL